MILTWCQYNRDDKKATTPETDWLVWIVEDLHGEVSVGYFDGTVWRTWEGSGDCSVSWWAPITYPSMPKATS